VFTQADDTPIDPRRLTLYFTQALKRAGLPAIRLHDARYTYATWMLEQGISPKIVQTMLGIVASVSRWMCIVTSV
jgi:integrase